MDHYLEVVSRNLDSKVFDKCLAMSNYQMTADFLEILHSNLMPKEF
jgi:hypothetical protein